MEQKLRNKRNSNSIPFCISLKQTQTTKNQQVLSINI